MWISMIIWRIEFGAWYIQNKLHIKCIIISLVKQHILLIHCFLPDISAPPTLFRGDSRVIYSNAVINQVDLSPRYVCEEFCNRPGYGRIFLNNTSSLFPIHTFKSLHVHLKYHFTDGFASQYWQWFPSCTNKSRCLYHYQHLEIHFITSVRTSIMCSPPRKRRCQYVFPCTRISSHFELHCLTFSIIAIQLFILRNIAVRAGW